MRLQGPYSHRTGILLRRKRHQSLFTLLALAGTGHVRTRREGGLLQPGKDRRLTRNQTCQHLDLAPQTSSTVRKYVCSKHPVCGLLYGSLADQRKWKCWEGGLTSVGFLPKCDLGLSSPGVLATPRPPLVSPALWLCQRSGQGRSFSVALAWLSSPSPPGHFQPEEALREKVLRGGL